MIEILPETFTLLKDNVKDFHEKNKDNKVSFNLVNDDSIHYVLENNFYADLFLLDPPWGG